MIITEKEKSLAVFSSLLFRHYPELKEQLHGVMRSYHKAVGMVCHTKDYWVRDFMPAQADEDVFVKFIFNPDYLQDKKKYITDVAENGGYPPTQNGDIRSLFMLFTLLAMQN